CLIFAHSFAVPIADRLFHATDKKHLELAIARSSREEIKFDSLTVDASHTGTYEEKIVIAQPWVEKAIKSGIVIEVELGSLEDGEAELGEFGSFVCLFRFDATSITSLIAANVKIDQTGTGALILVPSVGNLHDSYIQSDGLKFNRDILKALHDKFRGHVSRCLHGTGESLDELFNKCIKNGVSEITFSMLGIYLHTLILVEHQLELLGTGSYTSPSHFPITSEPLSHLCRTIVYLTIHII
ncbi:hypothetical protein K435DRAFT_695688, partial [Dendrothele bispora CBS 962.96]